MQGSLFLLDGGVAPDGRRLYRVCGMLSSDTAEEPGLQGVEVTTLVHLDATNFGGSPGIERGDLNRIMTTLRWPIGPN